MISSKKHETIKENYVKVTVTVTVTETKMPTKTSCEEEKTKTPGKKHLGCDRGGRGR